MGPTKLIACVLVLLSSTVIYITSADDKKTFDCTTSLTDVTSSTGYLSIKRNQGPCGFQANEKTVSFIVRTDNLILSAKEYIEIAARNAAEQTRKITGPVGPGYLVMGVAQPTLTFHLNSTESSTMLLEFTQHQDKTSQISLQVDGNRRDQLSIRSIDVQQYELNISKSISDPLHVEIVGSSDGFGHFLIAQNNLKISVNIDKNPTNGKQVNLALSPVKANCSASHVDEKSVVIATPDTQNLTESYTCVHIFETQKGDHYDVDFANFLDIVDVSDELIISDQTQTLTISRSTATKYSAYKPNVSFKGKKLAIVYNSPIIKEPSKTPVKLIVNEAQSGGVVDSYGKLLLPNKVGTARYTMKPTNNSRNIALDLDNIKNAEIKISDGRNNAVTIPEGSFLPSTIAFMNVGEEIILELNAKSSPPVGTITYNSGNDCSGTIFGSSGTISIKEGRAKRTCYWLLGGQSTLKIIYNALEDGSLEVYSLASKNAVLSKSKLPQTEVLPPMVIGPSYLKITLNSPNSSFTASVSPVVKSQVSTSEGSQQIITSVGYPVSYSWSNSTDTRSILAASKSIILAIADRDLRVGEKLLVDTKEVGSLIGLSDFDVIKTNSTISLVRSSIKDFSLRKGYKFVLQEYQSVISANTSSTSIKTPDKATNLLLRISAAANNRLTYSITFSDASTNYLMRVLDSRSILGRPVDEPEKVSGSTTSNMLLVDIKSTKDKTFLPQLTVNYKQVACNTARDHICDAGTRCVPPEKMCKGVHYCQDGSDAKVPCSAGPTPPPKIIQNGLSGLAVFFLCSFMFAIGIVAALFGPNLFKSLENRYRSGHYTTFSSTE